MRNAALILLLLSMLALACNKRDEEIPKITPALLSAPTCSDTSDDGIFESWNATEDSLMFPSPTHYTMPTGLYKPGYLQKMSLLSSRIASTDRSFTIHATYDTGVYWNTEFFLVNKATGTIDGWAYTARSSNPSENSITEKLVLDGNTPLTPGCHRLYYWGGRTTAPISTSQSLRRDAVDVFFKGHYDVEVY